MGAITIPCDKPRQLMVLIKIVKCLHHLLFRQSKAFGCQKLLNIVKPLLAGDTVMNPAAIPTRILLVNLLLSTFLHLAVNGCKLLVR